LSAGSDGLAHNSLSGRGVFAEYPKRARCIYAKYT
jgi:hypothetical protein